MFNATDMSELDRDKVWDPIPAEKRATREEIPKMSNLYFDRFSNVSVVAPW